MLETDNELDILLKMSLVKYSEFMMECNTL